MPGSSDRLCFEFEGYCLDKIQRRLSDVDDNEVFLSSRAFDTLLYLVEHQGEVIEKADLIKAVWPNVFVDENNLNQAISGIRKALGDVSNKHRFIITIPGRGYQFVPAVGSLTENSVPVDSGKPQQQISQRRKQLFLLSGIILMAMLIIIMAYFSRGQIQPGSGPVINNEPQISTDKPSIAILPFVDMSPDQDQSYFGDGLSEELLNGLAKIEGLQVIARTSSFSFSGQNLDVREIGQILGAAYILEGSVKISDEKFRITTQLIESKSGMHRWSETYDRSISDLFTVQDDISRNIILALKDILNIDEEISYPLASTRDLEAYSLYLRGRALYRTFDYENKDMAEQAIEHLRSAVKIDPNFSDAFVALADSYLQLANWYGNYHLESEREEVFALALEACKVALDLAPDSSEAMRALAMISNDPVKRKQSLRQAIVINKNNVNAYLRLSGILQYEGIHLDEKWFEEGARIAHKAHQLDPLNYLASGNLARVYLLEGKLKEASIYFRLALEQRTGMSSGQPVPDEALVENRPALSDTPHNLDFEESTRYWNFQQTCADNYEFSISDEAFSDTGSGYLVSLPESVGWCNTVQAISTKEYAGKYIRLVGMIKTNGFPDATQTDSVSNLSTIISHAKLWLRVDGDIGDFGFADGWPKYINKNTDWTPYELRLYVPEDAVSILFGAVLFGKGEMWMDDFQLEASDNPEFN